MDWVQRVPIIGKIIAALDLGVFIPQFGNKQSTATLLNEDAVAAHKEVQRQKVAAAVSGASSLHNAPSLLIFPEGVLTNGTYGVLRYQKFVFSLGVPVQPVAIRRSPPRFIPICCDASGTTSPTNMLWLFFLPRAHYEIELLPQMTRGIEETEIEFANRAQRATAEALGLHPSKWGAQDKNEWCKGIADVAGWRPCGARAATVEAFDASMCRMAPTMP